MHPNSNFQPDPQPRDLPTGRRWRRAGTWLAATIAAVAFAGALPASAGPDVSAQVPFGASTVNDPYHQVAIDDHHLVVSNGTNKEISSLFEAYLKTPSVFVYGPIHNSSGVSVIDPDVAADHAETFGTSTAIHDDVLAIGSTATKQWSTSTSVSCFCTFVDASWPVEGGRVRLYDRAGIDWTLRTTIERGGLDDRFGGSSDLNAETLMVGMPGADRGGVYFFDSASAAEQAFASAGTDASQFGAAVALDGDLAVVGAPGDGFATVFARFAQGGWNPIATVEPPAGTLGFGSAVDVDGSVITVAADTSRTAYVYHVDGTLGVSEVAQLQAPDLAIDVAFGRDVAIANGSVLVGAPWGVDGGQVVGVVYEFVPDGAGYALVTTHTAPQPEEFTWFGVNVAASDRYLAIASRDGPVSVSGAAEDFYDVDTDGDGVVDRLDACPDTRRPEAVPTIELLPGRYALIDGDSIFDRVDPTGNPVYSLHDTVGCSAGQILNLFGVQNQTHYRHGATENIMRFFVAIIDYLRANLGAGAIPDLFN